jgi:GxxExxY protein
VRPAGASEDRTGCFESAYSPCFAYELKKSKLEFHSQVPLTIHYEGMAVSDAYIADYTIEGCVIGELKAVEHLAPVHSRQMDTYLKITGYPLGLVLNFGSSRFLDGVVRRVNNFPHGTRRRAKRGAPDDLERRSPYCSPASASPRPPREIAGKGARMK